MMNVERFVLGLAVEMRGVLEEIGRHDRDAARARFESALGSGDEVKGVLLVAEALGYIEGRPQLVDGFDRVARTYFKLRG